MKFNMISLGTQSITVADDDVRALAETNSQANLVLGTMRDAVHVFVNGKLAGKSFRYSEYSGASLFYVFLN